MYWELIAIESSVIIDDHLIDGAWVRFDHYSLIQSMAGCISRSHRRLHWQAFV